MRTGSPLVLWLALGCSSEAASTSIGPDASGSEASSSIEKEAGTVLQAEGGASRQDAASAAVPDAGPSVFVRNDAGPLEWPACTSPPCITQINNCAIPIWVHALATAAIDGGNVRKLEPGAALVYSSVPVAGGGRLYAYYKEPPELQQLDHPVSFYNQFVEMTVDKDDQGRWAQNYNISYVDYIALPVSMTAVPRPGQTCQETACRASVESIVSTCPTEVRNLHGGVGTCMGSWNYCITQDPSVKLDSGEPATYDQTKEYCYKMAKPAEPESNITEPVIGSRVYGGYFPENPPWSFWEKVAGWNRGTFPGDEDDANYYKTEPYNHYAGWLHVTLGCSRVYAFSTDDHQNKSGFVRCSSDELRVVWCQGA